MLAICITLRCPRVPARLTSGGHGLVGGRASRALTAPILAKKGANKGKAVAKGDLPTKVCATCGLPFTWRKKWKDCWDEVRYCSDRCRGNRGKAAGTGGAPAQTE